MDDSFISTANGNYLQQCGDNGGDNQLWKLAVDGTIPIVQGSTQSTAAQTSDGSVSGISILSINGGNATTYSQTELDYAASLYYDPYTAGFLFDNGWEINGNAVSNSGTAPAALGFSGPVYPWHDYQVESDHFVIAWFATYAGYYDPFGFSGSDPGDDSGDEIWDATGIGVWLTQEYIYLGSTFADQTYMPQDLLSSIPLSDNDNTVYVPSNGIPTFTTTITDLSNRIKAYLPLAAAAVAVEKSINGNQSLNRIPALLVLATDKQCVGYCTTPPLERDRLYFLKDSEGHP